MYNPDISLFTFNSSSQGLKFKGGFLAIITAICLAAGASFYKKGLEKTDAFSGNLIRTGFASLGFFIFMVAKGTLFQSLHMLTSSICFWLFISAFFGYFLGDFLFLSALKRTEVSRTVPVSSTYPLFIAGWTSLLYGNSVSIFLVLGMILIITAIKLISEKNGSEREPTQQKEKYRGIGCALLAALSWSISISILDYVLLFLPPEAVAGFRFSIAFFMSMILGSVKKISVSRNSLFWIGIGGMSMLVFGNYFFLEAISEIGSAKVAPISSTYPIISVLLAVLFLREKINLKIVSGAFLSFLGVLFVIFG
jgi:DME family drug/metabolite transporter